MPIPAVSIPDGYVKHCTETNVQGLQNPWNLPLFKNPSFLTTKSKDTLNLALEWIKDCAQHQRCKITGDQQLPTRILDVGRSRSDEIVLRETVNQNGRYLCLSYCWGGEKFINTTRENIESHKKRIPWAMMPRTFQDAVEIARELEINYIWIDALCIVQDDRQDWEREAAKMAAIYHNSFLTIAATAAASPMAGLFCTHAQINISSVSVQLVHHFPNSPTDDTSNRFPLLGRAWTYQERMLAPRVLHFGQKEIVWECFNTRRCECGGKEGYFIGEVSKSHFYNTITRSISGDFQTREQLWRQIVVAYSPLALTVTCTVRLG
jgi:Heterokaryon incompatibility protein (HET)